MPQVAVWLALPCAAAALSAGLIVILMPLLRRYALARPNARSSHAVPTPQGAGIAVIAATLAVAIGYLGLFGMLPSSRLMPLTAATVGLALIGFVDDVAPMPPWPRLAVQGWAAVALLEALPAEARALPLLPYAVEYAICIVGLVWFVNLTNFMDGIDGMTVAGIVPPLAGVALLSGQAPLELTAALALIGALAGFAPFNRHVASVFLGDVGSLAIGGIAGWLLLGIACNGHLAAALILPLYYLADTGVTLFRRWRRGERLSQAHREHCYQRALAQGLTVRQVVARVWTLDAALLVLAIVAGRSSAVWLQVACLLAAGVLTAVMLGRFEAGR